ncbi:hypothetical protein TRAPUB_12441 [Trametes pubescens]|uniref:Uncharacterized protein n=1 Tax=Trametes pubescens TaxID=154538 RepID=A0A1M2VTZ7_TRAPU|nr:hypothetical protein TRAPUB_12441 [Trametes pubescens]
MLCARQALSSAKERPCAVNIWACLVRIAIRDGLPGSGRRTNGSGGGDEQTSVVASARSHASPVSPEPPVSSESISKASPTWDGALNSSDVMKTSLCFSFRVRSLNLRSDEPSGEVGWNERPSLSQRLKFSCTALTD